MKTIAQQLNIKDFPFTIKDNNGDKIYYENSDGLWFRCEYDENGREIYYETSTGYWQKREFDEKKNEIYYEDSTGYWIKKEWDKNGNQIYFEDSDGFIEEDRAKQVELTMDEIASKFNINVSQLKIKK